MRVRPLQRQELRVAYKVVIAIPAKHGIRAAVSCIAQALSMP